MASLIRSFSLTDKDMAILESFVKQYSFRSVSAALSFVLNMVAKQPLFLKNNSTVVECGSPIDSTPSVNLPGMNERIVKTQMERWQLSAEEYMAIVQKLINDFAASGGQMKNPENLIWKACSRYVHERDIQKRANAAAQTTPSADGSGESIYELQDRLG